MNKVFTKKTKKESFLKKGISKITFACTLFTAVLSQNIISAMADDGTGAKSAGDILGSFLGTIVYMFQLFGVGLFVYGIITAIMGHREDQPEKQSAGIKQALVGILLIGSRPIINGLLVLTGMDITLT